MRFLIIDADADYRQLLRYHLEVEWPDATIDEVQPNGALTLPDQARLDKTDLILLGHPLAHERGFQWLELLQTGEELRRSEFGQPKAQLRIGLDLG